MPFRLRSCRYPATMHSPPISSSTCRARRISAIEPRKLSLLSSTAHRQKKRSGARCSMAVLLGSRSPTTGDSGPLQSVCRRSRRRTTFRDSADAVLSRLVEGLVRAVELVAKGNAASHASCEPPPQSSARALSPVSIAEFAASQIKRKAQRALDSLLQGGRRWSVAWRRTNNRRPPRGATLRVEDFQTLRDDGRRFYADPFVLHHGGLHHVFVEELPYATGRGIISHFTIDAGRTRQRAASSLGASVSSFLPARVCA